jgi:hypothetical protein
MTVSDVKTLEQAAHLDYSFVDLPIYLPKTPVSALIQREPIPSDDATGVTEQLPNQTGLPDQLKVSTENLSGLSLDDVRVHYNTSKPAELQALAYAQATDIHVAPGQERHLPHEAWHVVQQKQGRVKPTMKMKKRIPVNDDAKLEDEADVMGNKAAESQPSNKYKNSAQLETTDLISVTQRKTYQNPDHRLASHHPMHPLSNIIQRFKISGEGEEYPSGSVTATKEEIFNWLNGSEMWGKVDTDWCLVGGSAHVEIVEHLLSSNFSGVVDALVHAMGAVPPMEDEGREAYRDFFVHQVMSTEDLDIAVTNQSVADEFPVNQSGVKRLLCTNYPTKPAVDLLYEPKITKFQLPKKVWVEAPKSLLGMQPGGRAGLLAAINTRKKPDEEKEDVDGKGRKRAARKKILESFNKQGLLADTQKPTEFK